LRSQSFCAKYNRLQPLIREVPMLSADKVERRARQLLTDAKVKEPPVDVHAIAHLLGATIRSVDGENDISGAIIRVRNKITIGVNANHAVVRKRFTIAHEIGHLILHDAEALVDHRYAQAPRDEIKMVGLRARVSSQAVDPR